MDIGEQESNSLVHIQGREAFPKKGLTCDDSSLSIPFPPLPGEAVEFLGRTNEGVIALSNYRLFVHLFNGFCNVPLCLIEYVECRDIFFLHVYCKNAKSLRCTFATNDICLEWHRRLIAATLPPKKLEDIFACAFYTWCKEETDVNGLHNTFISDGSGYNIKDEMKRMGFNTDLWRISDVNSNYKLCPTYPAELIVPSNFRDEDLENVASFRSLRRIPAVVWKHRWHGTVIARCSQPEVGLLGWRRSQDENLVHAIARTSMCSDNSTAQFSHRQQNGDINGTASMDFIVSGAAENEQMTPPCKKLLIVDARSYAAAVVNRAKGGGSEFPEYYPNCEIQFMNLANIHSIRKSFHSVRALCSGGTDQANWLSVLESTKWLHYLSALLRSALVVVNSVDRDRRSVLVHCSDGWDRTPQITALAELMLDPYYRTIEGFQVLVEREWLAFGHKLADRCGHSIYSDDSNERCPVFLQWLDCVYQLVVQFQCSFEFNEAYLVKLTQHVYSCLFGTFLCNSAKQRKAERVEERTYSIWAYFRSNEDKFINLLYQNKEKVLRPAYQLKDLRFWSAVYLPSMAVSDDLSNPPMDDLKPPSLGMVKTRSCDDLLSAVEHAQSNSVTHNRARRSSDPSLLDGILDGDSDCAEGNRAVEPVVRPQDMDDSEYSEDSPDVTITSECSGTKMMASESNVLPATSTVNGYDYNHVTPPGLLLLNGTSHDNEADSLESSASEPSSTTDVTGCDNNGNSFHDEWACKQEEHIVESRSEIVPLHRTELSAIESSTDTLVGESDKNGISTPNQNGECENMTNGISVKTNQLPNGNNQENASLSVSTSTSDISDPYIYGHGPEVMDVNRLSQVHIRPRELSNKYARCVSYVSGKKLQDFGADCLMSSANCMVPSCMLGLKDEVCERTRASGLAASDIASTNSTPIHSRTPSSGLGTTPSEDRMYAITHQLDSDGSTQHKDEVHHRLHHIYREHKREIESLKNALRAMNSAMCQQVCCRCNPVPRLNSDCYDDSTSNPDSVCSGDVQSLGLESAATSDTSWEHVDEGDTQVTLWVPDHVATKCMGCGSAFWLANPRHHCRSCGRLFCGSCTKQSIPLPSEQLFTPVRVCNLCFNNQQIPHCKQQACRDGKGAKCVMAAATAAAYN